MRGKMIRRFVTPIAIALVLILGVLVPAGATAAPAPAWELSVIPLPTNFAPGTTAEYLVVATNIGGKQTSGPVTIKDTLPTGVGHDKRY